MGLGFNINPASSFADPAASGASLGLAFNNSGAGIIFGSQDFGAQSLAASPTQTTSDPATASASATGQGNPGSAANAPLTGAGGIATSPLVMVLIVVAAGVGIYALVRTKKK